MPSFQLSVTPHRRVAARFIESVRRRLQKAYAEAEGIKQADIAREIGVHRSVINRQLRGYQDMTLGRVAELAWALGYEPIFELISLQGAAHTNARSDLPAVFKTQFRSTEAHKSLSPALAAELTAV